MRAQLVAAATHAMATTDGRRRHMLADVPDEGVETRMDCTRAGAHFKGDVTLLVEVAVEPLSDNECAPLRCLPSSQYQSILGS